MKPPALANKNNKGAKMGCDIHFFVERRLEDGSWESCDEWVPDDWQQDLERVAFCTGFYDGRCYDLFAMLANVRNGYGSAGLDTGDGFNVIVMPKGLPKGLSPQVSARAEYELEHCHTPTWLTLSEILEFDWSQTTTKRGYVDGVEYEAFLRSGHADPPSIYSALVMPGGGTSCVGEAELVERIEAIKANDPREVWEPKIRRELKNIFCDISWQVSYRHVAGSFLTETVPRMQKLGDPNDVRCVFWFDN